MVQTLEKATLRKIGGKLEKANRQFNKIYPGESPARQPVHTVYGGAHLFSAGMVGKFRDTALRTLKDYAPTPSALARALEVPANDKLWSPVYERIQKKLQSEPVEDFRIDFEDGYGNRPDQEEDSHAVAAARETAKGMRETTLPPFIGIRIKPFSEMCFTRSIRTLDIFVSTLAKETKGKLPENFVVTLPKVVIRQQVTGLVEALETLEKKNKIKTGTLKFEFMVETPQSIINSDGVSPLRGFVTAGKGRCTGAHLGTYDYTAGVGITASYQTMDHLACDFAKQMMKVSLTGTGVFLSDGATNVMPVGPHKGTLTDTQKRENEATVHRAWRLGYSHIRHSLASGYYQGWDLHPAQLPIRYAAVYSFFLESLDSATERLRGFMEKAARATLLGDVFDDAATGQGLFNFFLCALGCGAISEAEVIATGLSLEEIQTRSFQKILTARS
jgi:citrate lyase beta subunit